MLRLVRLHVFGVDEHHYSLALIVEKRDQGGGRGCRRGAAG
jgi:hypothetical protein